MKRELTIRRTILAMALAAFGVSGMAIAAPENEPNNSLSMPQAVEDIGPGGVATITGSISGPADVDFYSFNVKQFEDPANPTKRTKIAIDIDVDSTQFPEHDLVVYVLDPNGTRRFTGQNASYDPANDPQSAQIPGFPTMTLDPRLEFPIDVDGKWTVAVAAMPVQITTGGVVKGQGDSIGGYTLNISGLQPTMQEIAIDVKPGVSELWVLNPKSKGVIQVALLSEEGFDPFEVDAASLTFGRNGDEASYLRCVNSSRDFNGDGKPDRVCHFDNEKTGFTRADTLAKMKGTKGGKPFQGTGDLKVIAQKHKE